VRDKLENLISESCSSLTNEIQNWLNTNKVEASLISVSLHRFSPDKMLKDVTHSHKHQEGGMVFVHGDTQTL
ncbi:flagellar motor switch protein FliM, partial [Vibrio parahaemolyticus]